MDWKINYWTILFALAAIGLLATLPIFGGEAPTTTATPEVKPVPDCDTVRIDTISFTTGFERIGEYIIYAEFLKDALNGKSPTAPSDWSIITNLDVQYFRLPRCELQQMLERIPNGDVYAYLSIEDDPDSTKHQRIDLLFYDQAIDLSTVKSGSTAAFSGGNFFDFTNPCPTSCPPYN